jgi:phytoene dehydrogenase-like protein
MHGAGMKILCALDDLPVFRAAPAAAAPILARAGAISLVTSIAGIEQAWQDAQAGRASQSPLIELTIPSATDSTLAPPGKHVMSMHIQWTPYELKEGSWDELGEVYADRVLAQLADYMPNLPEILLARKVLTPLSLEREYALTQGQWEHGDTISGQLYAARPLPGWAGGQTPLPGLSLCGAGIHPGGPVSGIPGYNAAQRILAEADHAHTN